MKKNNFLFLFIVRCLFLIIEFFIIAFGTRKKRAQKVQNTRLVLFRSINLFIITYRDINLEKNFSLI